MTKRTLDYLEEQGYHCDVCERWIPRTKIRKDLFGWMDILAFSQEEGIVGVQCTSGNNHASRRKKVSSSPSLPAWKESGGRAFIISWGKRGKNKEWTPRVEEV